MPLIACLMLNNMNLWQKKDLLLTVFLMHAKEIDKKVMKDSKQTTYI